MSRMLVGLLFCLANCCAVAPHVQAVDALADRLASAIKQLESQGSYRWDSETENANLPRFRTGRTQGTTISGGMTHVSMAFGPRLLHIVVDSDKAAVLNRESQWETVSLVDQGYSSAGFSASLAREVQTPVEEARALAASLSSLHAENDVIVGTLRRDAVEKRLNMRQGSGELRDANGTVRFSVVNGVLVKFDLLFEGKRIIENDTVEINLNTSVTISDIGTAELTLPFGAIDALKRPVPKPEPRLSVADENALLSLRGKRDVGVHDPSSIVKCGDEYWFFSTGTGVSSWRSKDLQTWERGPRVFPEIPGWVTDVVPDQRGHFWAPDIVQIDDRFLLYYSVSSFGKNTSAIALASTPTLNPDDPAYRWVDEGIVIESSSQDDFNAIDPAVIRTESGDLWMSFGSFWSGLKLIKLDSESGKRHPEDTKLYSIANYRQIEAPHIYQHDGWFYLFVNWGKCCLGVDSTYNIRVGRSRTITGPYLDEDGVDLTSGGGTLFLGSEGPFIGPGHANVLRDQNRFLLSCHYYDATERGRSMLSIQELTWSKDGWPVITEQAPTSKESTSEDSHARKDSVENSAIPVDWIDDKTGHRVIRLSKEAGSASLYFHQNAYTPEGDKLLISTPRGLEVVDLETRELKVVVPKQSYAMSGSSGVEMGRKSRQVYYSTRSGRNIVVQSTHVDTLKTREIVTLPLGATFNSVNADETLLFGSLQEFQPRDSGSPGRRSRNQNSNRQRNMKLFTVEIATGKMRTFHQSTAWLNHLQCSPKDPSMGLYCYEGPWHELDRVWTIRFGSDNAKLMHQRQQQYEIAGHEFFSADGQWVWYDLQTPRSDRFWLAGVHVGTGERIGYRLAREMWSVHYNISPEGNLFAGDGGGPKSVANQTPLPEKRRLDPPGNGQWIYLFRPQAELTDGSLGGEPAKLGEVSAERLVDLSKHNYDLEPNVTFTPDGKWIVFRSNMHGERHVYMVSVERGSG